VTLAHKHICDDCVCTWEHVDKTCYRNYKKVLTCDGCMAIAREKVYQKEAWAEIARSMPIPHDHKCVICEQEWGHNEKKCAIEEHYWLECEPCMTELYGAKEYFCPKCGRDASKIKDCTLSSVCYVCPHCQHYFYPQGDMKEKKVSTTEGDTEINICEHVCPRCGTHFASNKGDANLCAGCGHWFPLYNSSDQSGEEFEGDEMDDYGHGFC